jgi:hypothetical protein
VVPSVRRLKPCARCGAARTLAAISGWNVVVEFGYNITGLRVGYITGLLCPSCQTPEEHAEAVIFTGGLRGRDATLSRVTVGRTI